PRRARRNSLRPRLDASLRSRPRRARAADLQRPPPRRRGDRPDLLAQLMSAYSYARIQHDGRDDVVAVEEPLEIRVDGSPLTVTMRTPGHDEELALGFLYGEGLIDGPRPAGPTEDFAANIVEVAGPLNRDPGERRFYTTSSCGVCGKGAL